MLGDSTLYGGSYIDQDELYSTRLEKLLNAKYPGLHIEVLAMGTNGWGPFHERGFVQRRGTFNADLAIVNLPIDDINRSLYGLMCTPFTSVQSPPHFALEEVVNHYAWEFKKNRAGLDAKWEAEQSQIGIQEYGHLADDLQAHGLEVMFACLPSRDAGMNREASKQETLWRGQLEATLAKRNVSMSFPQGLFVGKGDEKQIYHDDVHLNAPGHKIYADFLCKHVSECSKSINAFLLKYGSKQ